MYEVSAVFYLKSIDIGSVGENWYWCITYKKQHCNNKKCDRLIMQSTIESLFNSSPNNVQKVHVQNRLDTIYNAEQVPGLP